MGTPRGQPLIYLQIARMLETTSSGASIRRSRSPAPMSWSGSSRNSTDRKWPAHLTVRGPFSLSKNASSQNTRTGVLSLNGAKIMI